MLAGTWQRHCGYDNYDLRTSTAECLIRKGAAPGCGDVHTGCVGVGDIQLLAPRALSNLVVGVGPLWMWLPLWLWARGGRRSTSEPAEAQVQVQAQGEPEPELLRVARRLTTVALSVAALTYLSLITAIRYVTVISHALSGAEFDPSGHVFVYGLQLVPLWLVLAAVHRASHSHSHSHAHAATTVITTAAATGTNGGSTRTTGRRASATKGAATSRSTSSSRQQSRSSSSSSRLPAKDRRASGDSSTAAAANKHKAKGRPQRQRVANGSAASEAAEAEEKDRDQDRRRDGDAAAAAAGSAAGLTQHLRQLSGEVQQELEEDARLLAEYGQEEAPGFDLTDEEEEAAAEAATQAAAQAAEQQMGSAGSTVQAQAVQLAAVSHQRRRHGHGVGWVSWLTVARALEPLLFYFTVVTVSFFHTGLEIGAAWAVIVVLAVLTARLEDACIAEATASNSHSSGSSSRGSTVSRLHSATTVVGLLWAVSSVVVGAVLVGWLEAHHKSPGWLLLLGQAGYDGLILLATRYLLGREVAREKAAAELHKDRGTGPGQRQRRDAGAGAAAAGTGAAAAGAQSGDSDSGR